jgi:hypothetical protein
VALQAGRVTGLRPIEGNQLAQMLGKRLLSV